MQQTFYIESDEEIISVIGRLRKSGSEKNFFVFPKRALVLQSIINLRLFQREAQKLGKKVVVVTQDEAGRALAEKAGMETEQYSDDFSKATTHVELVSSFQSQPTDGLVPPSAVIGTDGIMPHSDTIGSSDFHAMPQPMPVPRETAPSVAPRIAPDVVQKLRVRNASPERQPSLNSVRYAEEISAMTRGVTEIASSRAQDAVPARQAFSPHSAEISSGQLPREERLKNFFSNRIVAAPLKPAASVMPEKTALAAPHILMAGKKASIIFGFFGVVAVISLIGVCAMLFLPEAAVQVTPHKMVRNMDMQFDAVAPDGMPSSGEMISARIIEKDITASLSAVATGSSGSSSQKARGTVVISNSFSKESQPLIATTRFETSDGRIFRLVSSVVVPGMTTIGGIDTPGAIEASVIADQAGDGYNIDPTTFTIPGFKGSPKFDKFSAKSTKAFIGGSSSGSDMAVISKADIDKAENDAKQQVKNSFLEEMKKTLSSDEKILEESIEIVPQSVTPPQTGTIASSFDYQGMFRVRAFIFSEGEIRARFEKSAVTTIQDISFHPISVTLAYGEALPDYERRSTRIRAHALISLESDIDQDKLRSALAGQDAEGIEKILDNFPGIKKINVDFSPSWFVTSVPKAEDRILITVNPGEE